jgi:fructan beta-fructosidase
LYCTVSEVVRAGDAGARTFNADKRYLAFPCSHGLGGQNKVFINVDGKHYMSVYDALIASSNPDHWRCIDLKLLHGREVSVRIEGPNAAGIELVKTSDTIPGKYPLYQKPGRPQVHFSPLRGWLNDPCGMFYSEDKWHLYYASKPFYNVMGRNSNAWGHAISTDLLHWEEQPILLPPVEGQYSFWTGGAAVDVENITGLGLPGKPAVVFSANNGNVEPHAFTQCIFVSTDGGMTVDHHPERMYKPLPKEASRRGGRTRDPMIIWYDPEKKWVMVVFNHPPGGREGFYFFESRDLENWAEMSVLEDMYECPNLFQLPVNGNKADMRWIIWGSPTEYLIGTFNGRAFVPDDNRRLRSHYGQFSASQVFANAPGGRIVQIGWAHCCNYDTEFSQMASFPLELSLRTTPEGLRLYADFVPELANLRKRGSRQKDVVVKTGAPLKVGDVTQPAEIIVEFEPGSASQVTFAGAELDISWSARSQELRVKEVSLREGQSPAGYRGYHGETIRLSPKNGCVVLHILLDIPSVEVVTGGGENYAIQGRDFRKLGAKSPMEILAEGGDVRFNRLEVYPLRSIH